MISRSLLQRLKRLEERIQTRVEPEVELAHIRLLRRIDAARRRAAIFKGEEYVPMCLGPETDTEAQTSEMIEILNAGRLRRWNPNKT